MGVALAARAAARGADVTLVAANLGIPVPDAIRLLPVATAAELKEACEREFGSSDVLLMAAAVADFRPAAPFEGKIKKTASPEGPPAIAIERTEDVISALVRTRDPRQVLVGFAAEHGEDAVRHGREKLKAKRLDAVVVNDISRRDIGFEAPSNEVAIVTEGGERWVPRTSKEEVADAVLDEVERLRSKREEEEEEKGGRAGAHSTGRGRI
jgi:phosphopantothenoylcysteine decarboxylase/phosphopantothenate--cysteine ligase